MIQTARNLRASFIFATLVFFSALTATAQNNALSLNGTNAQVDCPASPLFNTASSIRAMECWVRWTALPASGFREIVSKSTISQGFEILISNAGLSMYLMRNSTNYYIVNYPAANLSSNTWYHVVGTWDGANASSVRLYVNGVAVGSPASAGSISAGLADVGTLKIGQWSDAENRAFPGQIDEVRIWSANRTALEVKRDMLASLPPNTPNLIAYYRFNETSGTSAVNSTNNTGLDATIVNGTRVASPIGYAYNSLDFDGVDDYVIAPANTAYDISTGTVELMFRPAALSTENSFLTGIRGGASTRFSFHVSNTAIGLWNGTTLNMIPYTFNNGQWYHLAFVCNGTNTRMYVDGNLHATAIPGIFGTATGLPLQIGMLQGTASERFRGAIDEVRYWSTQRSQPEIQGTKDFSLQGNETGLVALYSFDQGIAQGSNTGLTQLPDRSSTANFAVLNGFGLTSTNSNFVNSPVAVTLPVVLQLFNAFKSGEKVIINWSTSTESNTKEFVIERSANGTSFSQTGSIAAAGFSNKILNYSFTDQMPLAGKNFYRLKIVDRDSKTDYSEVRVVDFSATAAKLSWSSINGSDIDIRYNADKATGYFITDASGRVVKKGNLNPGTQRFSGLRAGVYLLSADGGASVRFVVR
ncbi:MAG: LamG domain-containing protein [Chitinophagaceae bacterium]|nr:MAG: LamG domain-containing protein [Chitinophagaceae bacterium]